MRQQGKCITGDPILVDNYTADWLSIKMHPTSYYRRQDAIIESLEQIKGPHTIIDMGQFVTIRFLNKDDVTAFYRMHHAYL